MPALIDCALDTLQYSVRVRTSATDPYAGLKGIDYIKARGLAPQPNLNVTKRCAHCGHVRLLDPRKDHDGATEQPLPPSFLCASNDGAEAS